MEPVRLVNETAEKERLSLKKYPYPCALKFILLRDIPAEAFIVASYTEPLAILLAVIAPFGIIAEVSWFNVVIFPEPSVPSILLADKRAILLIGIVLSYRIVPEMEFV